MGRLKDMMQKAAVRLLDIKPANPKTITIYEKDTFETETLRNRLWYRGDPNELEQYFKKVSETATAKAKFWAAEPSKDSTVRKIHTGLPKMVVGKLADIVVADMDKIELKDNSKQELWDLISKDNKFPELVGTSISDTLLDGDGAFKITIDTNIAQYPIIEFYGGERVGYVYKRGRLQEIVYHTTYVQDQATYCLHEIYGKGYIDFKLYNARGDEVKLNLVNECVNLKPHNTFTGNFIMGVPLKFYKSPKYYGRGDSILGSKSDVFDALDEIVSQWIDAVRKGRIYRYIPKALTPKDPVTGEVLAPNVFDNDYVVAGNNLAEDAKENIEVSQAEIKYQAYVESYANYMDMCLQGIMSPSTLGIDLKKTDNAESQREKEHATITTCNKIIDALTNTIPELVAVVMMTYDNLVENIPGEYIASIKFGEYATPTFDKVVETVTKAKTAKIMSTRQAIKQMYGDTWTNDEIDEEIKLISEESGTIRREQPSINGFDGLEGEVPTEEDYPKGAK